MPLVKNTNSIRIILQQMDGVTVDVDNFEFTITDDNGLMNYDNKLLKDETLTYYPYYRVQGSTDMDTKAHVPRAILRIAISAWPLPRLP